MITWKQMIIAWIIAAILLSVLLFVAVPAVVYGIADPDSPPEVNAVYVYEDCLEDGDIGVLVDYYLDYASTPNETAAEAYMAIFIDTDGSTQLKAVAPYVYVTSGYGRGLIWIYFSADEVLSYSLDSANEALYRVWLVGNPTLSWPGDPPKTVATIDQWHTTGTTSTLVALRVLYYADILELAWSLDLIEATALGSRLTTLGEEYFLNVIQDLRTIAPNCFSSTTVDQTIEDIDYSTTWYAVAYNGTATITGSPVTLSEGSTNITITAIGGIYIELGQGVSGNLSNATGTVAGSPVNLVAGTNNATITGVGTVSVNITLVNTSTRLEDTILGTGLDLTDAATSFGMSRLMFSGIVWMGVSVLICAASYRVSRKDDDMFGGGSGSGKVVLLIFDVCIIGGALLGLLHILVAIMLFIAFGAFTGYVFFFKGANV